MRLANTTGNAAKQFYSHTDRVRMMYEAGFRYLDLSLYDPINSDLFETDGWEERVEQLKEFACNLGVTFVQAHSRGGNPLNRNGEELEALFASTVRSIEVCGRLGIPHTVVHVGFSSDLTYTPENKKAYFDGNLKFFSRLYPVMEKYGVGVLVENSTHANTGNMFYLYTGADMRGFLEYAHHPLLHACWDTGHANADGAQYQHLLDLGDHLHGLHVNDNRSERDEHMMPWMGSTNMDEIMCGLLDIGYKGDFTFECDSALVNPGYWLGARKEFPRETRLAKVPYEIQLEAEKLLYKMGEYILKAYDVFEA